MFSTTTFASRPRATSPRLPRAFQVSPTAGEFGWATWSYSRQAKLNAWSWSGVANLGNVNNWASLGNAVYVRGEADTRIYIMQPNAFLAAGETNSDSDSVEVITQWLDFGKPGKMKALSGMDFDGQNVETIEVYVSVNGGRAGTLAASIPIGDASGGWTYNGEVIPLEEVGAATEFKLRFICDGNQEAQINRLTVYFDEIQG